MEPIASYIPIDRRQALAQASKLPNRTKGAVLFADLSGYTALTAALAAELGAERGAEELTTQLNHLFGLLIEQVHAFQGSVISFGGDAITCWFDESPYGQAQSQFCGKQRALSSAVQMQRIMTQFQQVKTPAGSVLSLGIKLAVTAGDVRRFAVGIPEIQYMDVLAGHLLQRMAAAEALLKRDELIVDQELAEQFSDLLKVGEWRTAVSGEPFAVVQATNMPAHPTPWDEIPTLSEQIAQQWLLPPVYQRVAEGKDAYLGELRPATALFLRFGGIDYDHDDEAQQKLNAYITWVQTAVSRYEGHLLQIIIGDKGSYGFVIFGAPIAHEDDNARAVAVAQLLCHPPAELDFITNSHIGISRGVVHAGACGGIMRRTYSVHGAETNVAARLMMQAQAGQILLSANVASDIAEKYRLAEIGVLSLKGIPEPVKIYSLEGKKVASTSIPMASKQSILVGRDKELETLVEQLAFLQQGLNGVTLIEGEAGIGKSHLISALLHEASRQNIPYLLGSGNAIERQAPYHAWRSIFRSLFGITEKTKTAVVHQAVYAALGADSSDYYQLLPLLETVLPGYWQDNELTSQMDGEVRAFNTRRLLMHFLAQHCQQVGGFLLVLEDAYWFDSASWALLSEARKRLSPMLLVAASRPFGKQAPEAYRQLTTYPTVTHMRLTPLEAEDTIKLICQRLGVTSLPKPVIQLIQKQGEGHPFFSEELAFALRDTGHILIDGNQCRLAPGAGDLTSLNFPKTIQGIITSRVDRLATPHQLTLKVASVIGRVFGVPLLQSIYPIIEQQAQVPNYLLALAGHEITMPLQSEPELAYIFKHALTQEVVYSLMTFSQRQKLHQQTAEIYEARFAGDLSAHYPLLAYHWRKAENVVKAVSYLEKAGEQALRNFSNEEAITFFKQAIKIEQTAEFHVPASRRAQWHLQLGEAYVHWNKYEAGRNHLEKGLRLLNVGLPTARLRKVGKLLGAIAGQLGRPTRSKTAVFGEKRTNYLAASRAVSRLVEVYYQTGDSVSASHAAFFALQLAEKAGVSAELAESLGPVGMFFSFLQAHSRARRYLQRAQKTAESANALSALTYTLLINCVYECGMGNWAAAKIANDRLTETATRLGSIRRLHDGYQTKIFMDYSQSKFTETLKTADLLISSASQSKDHRFHGYGLFGRAYCYYRLGQFQKANHYLGELHTLFSEEFNLQDEKLYHLTAGLQARIECALGNDERGLSWARKAEDLGNGLFQDSYISLVGFASPVATYLNMWRNGRGEPALLKQRSKKAMRNLKLYAFAFPTGKPESLLWQGIFQQLCNNERRAIKLWQKGLSIAELLKMPYEAGRLHAEIGRFLPVEDPEKAIHLETAHKIFLHLGVMNQIKLVEQQLSQLKARPRILPHLARFAEEQGSIDEVKAEADDNHQGDKARHLGSSRDVEQIGS